MTSGKDQKLSYSVSVNGFVTGGFSGKLGRIKALAFARGRGASRSDILDGYRDVDVIEHQPGVKPVTIARWRGGRKK